MLLRGKEKSEETEKADETAGGCGRAPPVPVLHGFVQGTAHARMDAAPVPGVGGGGAGKGA